MDGILESSDKLNSKLRLKLKFELSLAKGFHPTGCSHDLHSVRWSVPLVEASYVRPALHNNVVVAPCSISHTFWFNVDQASY